MADFARGQLLVQLREQRHLSQEDAAHEIGTTAKSLRAWEHGGKIRWDNAKRVAEFYDIEPERLVSRELNGEPPADEIPVRRHDPSQADRMEAKLDDAVNRLQALSVQLAALSALVEENKRTLSGRASRTTAKKRAGT